MSGCFSFGFDVAEKTEEECEPQSQKTNLENKQSKDILKSQVRKHRFVDQGSI